jgi:hypothetical protein
MIGNNRKKLKQRKADDINQVTFFIKHLMATNRLERIDVFQLCYLLQKNGFMIEVNIEPELPFNVSSLWFEQQGQYIILYRGSPLSLNTQLHILHELSHILLGHSPFTLEDITSGRSIYTHSEEMEAEMAAFKIFSLLNPIKYDHLTEKRQSPSAIINRHPNHNGHLFREAMDIKPSVMTEEEIKISQQMSEFFAL